MDDFITTPRIGGQHAGYLFEFRSDGVYLTVYPSNEPGIQFELSDMRQILKEYSVEDYDLEMLARMVRETSGHPQRLSEHYILPSSWVKEKESKNQVAVSSLAVQGNEHVKYGKVNIEVSRDKMEAKVRFEVGDGETVPSIQMIEEALKLRNVVHGVDIAAIGDAALSGTETVVARGTPAVNGTDAQLIRKFDVGAIGRPVADEYDRVDYKNLNIFCMATKGMILVERIPHTKGKPGMNVHGMTIRQKPGKPKPLPNGKNTIVEDENFVVADMDGQVVDTGSKVSVDPHLEIKGDVGVSTGNIDFNGGITVNGSVQAGFVLKATGDIEIKGMVSGAHVEGRNISIKGGVQGMNRGLIKAENNFQAAFAENANIEADGNVLITDVAMHSTIRAGHVLTVSGNRGMITGGFLAAGEAIEATVIGNSANVVTRLTVGVNPMLQKKYQTVLKEYNETKKRLDQVTKMLNTLGKIDISLLPPEKAERINALVRSQFPLAGTVERNERTLREIDAELQKMKKGKIKVKDTMYPGVRLSINSIIKNVQVEESHCCQYVEDDFIKIGPY